MAFAGIFHPFARLRWIRFGLLMRDRKFSRRFSVVQTTALAPLLFADRTITSDACSDFLKNSSEISLPRSMRYNWFAYCLSRRRYFLADILRRLVLRQHTEEISSR